MDTLITARTATGDRDHLARKGEPTTLCGARKVATVSNPHGHPVTCKACKAKAGTDRPTPAPAISASEAAATFGVRRDKATGEWTLLDAREAEVGPRLPEAMTSTEALAAVAAAKAAERTLAALWAERADLAPRYLTAPAVRDLAYAAAREVGATPAEAIAVCDAIRDGHRLDRYGARVARAYSYARNVASCGGCGQPGHHTTRRQLRDCEVLGQLCPTCRGECGCTWCANEDAHVAAVKAERAAAKA